MQLKKLKQYNTIIPNCTRLGA